LRKFNNVAAERHIPHCKDSRHRAKAPPTKTEIDAKAKERRASLLRNTTGVGRNVGGF